MTAYLTEDQIASMTDEAFHAYEMSADWNSAARAAREYAVDELGIKPRKSAVLLAVKRAQAAWQGESQRVRRAIEAQR